MMRFTLAAVAAFLLVPTAQAQDEKKALEDKKQQKLKSAFLSKATWLTDYEKALAESKKSVKPIFAYFTRSYSP